MLDYDTVKKRDVLRIVGKGAPGFAENGEYVRVTEVYNYGVAVENKNRVLCDFVFACGAARLEWVEHDEDFPKE